MFATLTLPNGIIFRSSPKGLQEALARVRHEKAVGMIPFFAPEQDIALDWEMHKLFATEVVSRA